MLSLIVKSKPFANGLDGYPPFAVLKEDTDFAAIEDGEVFE